MEQEDISVGTAQILHKKIASNNALKVDQIHKEKEESAAANVGGDTAVAKVIKDIKKLEKPEEEQSEESETDESESESTDDLEEATKIDKVESDEDSSSSSSCITQVLCLWKGKNAEIETVANKEGTEKQEKPEDKEKKEIEKVAEDTSPPRSALNFARKEFMCEMLLEPKPDDDKTDYKERDIGTIDIREEVRDLLQRSCSECSPKITIDDELRDDIATDLNAIIVRPSQLATKKIKSIILMLMPVVAIDLKAGAICGYGILQLVAYGKKYAKRSKIFRGYAKNMQTFQNTFQMIHRKMH